LLNVAALAIAVAGLIGSPATVEASFAWIAIGVTSLIVMVGLVRDVARSRAHV
jgi:hypothetical protein